MGLGKELSYNQPKYQEIYLIALQYIVDNPFLTPILPGFFRFSTAHFPALTRKFIEVLT
jgi:hypothetical protein